MIMKKILIVLLLPLLLVSCQKAYTVKGNLVLIPCQDRTVRLQVISPEIVRVSVSPDGKFNDRQSLVVVPQEAFTDFKVELLKDVEEDGSFRKIRVTTDSLQVFVALDPDFIHDSGDIWFLDWGGGFMIPGVQKSRFEPITVEGKQAWSVQTLFETGYRNTESFYGLGQHQAGEFDHTDRNEELFQYNTKVSVPFVVSNQGYGLLFDAYSLSRWGNPKPYQQLGESFILYDKDGVKGALTGTYIPAKGEPLVQREDSLYYENEFVIQNLPKIPLNGAKVIYEGWIEAPETGDYDFIQYYAGFQQTTIGGQEVMSRRWRPAWNPNSYKFTVHLEQGVRTPVRIEWEPDGDVSYIGLRVAPLEDPELQDHISFWSEFEPYADYYLIWGGDYDGVIRGYRKLTGKAPVMPKWVLGFWQSRERYSTQQELVSTLAEFRRRHIPIDNIVQDWQYWKDDQWGSHEFDETRYPDPEKMMDDVHAMHGRLMISVWPKFYTNTDNYQELKAAGYAYTHAEDTGLVDWLGHKQTFYDAYAEGGRKMFWRQIDEDLYSKYGRKIDAWWMDASEPNLRDCLPMDYFKWLISPTALGPSTEYLNAYSLVNADAIYNGQRGVEPDRRVFLLTRSGFAGLQRYSTATWSGDIGTSWTDMRMQMAAGLNYSMSGIPFWGMDIGGFSVMSKFYDPKNLTEWRELQTRWHQFGTFVPLFRAHGQWPQRELWNIAPEGSATYESILWYMQLRYRLMPYLYSLAGAVYLNDYTILRGLPMDFPDDPAVRDLSDQWMFGPALMACPVSEYKARSRHVYFPEGGWYDFYSGDYYEGGRSRSIPAPYERMPLFVRAGSIIPFGPEIEWTGQKPDDDICLYIYAGADADFDLYEDDGESYAYERGAYSIISIYWNDADRELTFSPRQGSFPGMPENRRFRIVVVDPNKPHGYDPDAEDDYTNYNGELFFTTIR
jgi:alpha-D-xyloside xylohydrolase